MWPTLDPLAVVIGFGLLPSAIAVTVADGILLLLLFVRRVRPAAAVWLAAPPLFVYGAFQACRFAWFAGLPERSPRC